MRYWFKKKRQPVREYIGPDRPTLHIFFTVLRHEGTGGTDVRVVFRVGVAGEMEITTKREALVLLPLGERVRFTLDGSTSPGP